MKKEKKAYFPAFEKAAEKACEIDSNLFDKYEVKRGLRNKDKTGVLAGLTNIGDVVGYKKEGDQVIPVPGRLLYRGLGIEELTLGFQKDKRHGFEETIYLLLTGKLPNKEELNDFTEHLVSLRYLPDYFINDMILTLKGKDVLNILSRTILALYTLDDNADDITFSNLLSQALSIIAKFPSIIAYAYSSYAHAYQCKTLHIRHPQKELSIAENFLFLIKGKHYTKLEADLLDLSLVLHAEHGGGNNSTYTTRVISSTETDTYSAITAAVGSLKGPLHGGANIKVQEMLTDIMENVKNWKDEKEVKDYLVKILNKKANDGSGKIYGVGHAVYTISDPRATLLREKAKDLAIEKGTYDQWELYALVEKLAPEAFSEFKGSSSDKTVCINVDFYSGFVYSSIEIPKELYTPLFAMARVAGWCAHRIEELTFSGKRIVRPAYKNVYGIQDYISINDRK